MGFAYLLRPAFDETFIARAGDRERGTFEAHGEWLEAGFHDGGVRFAGRCDDGLFGLVVIDAADERAARELLERDPSVRDGVQHAELHPFRTFVAREPGSREG
jgi:uncharacterized protein